VGGGVGRGPAGGRQLAPLALSWCYARRIFGVMKKPTFGPRLRELRVRAGLTQAQLAERAGLSLAAVKHYEQGLREPTWPTLQALADALRTSCDAFREAPSPASMASRPLGRPPRSRGQVAKRPRK